MNFLSMKLWAAKLLRIGRPPRRSGPHPLTPQQKVGAAAESYTADWLRRHKGYRIVDHNWRHGRGEIDLIAKDQEILVFIEVRARQKHALVSGFHSVSRKKQEVLRRCALAYLNQCRPAPKHFRFDIAEIELNNQSIDDLRYYEKVPIFRKHDRPTHL